MHVLSAEYPSHGTLSRNAICAHHAMGVNHTEIRCEQLHFNRLRATGPLDRLAGAVNLPAVAGDRAVVLAVVAQPAAHRCGARAKVTIARSHAVAWRVTLGTEAVGF